MIHTALILSHDEWSFALKCAGNAGAPLAETMLARFRTENAESAAVSLAEKGLARHGVSVQALDPLLRFVARSALSAETIREPCEGAVALQCPKLHLLITVYGKIPNTWKIAPFQSAAALENAIAEYIAPTNMKGGE
jgi:hypothetical protein